MSSKKPLFIILGAGGFPVKISAAGNKYFLMAKALEKNGFDVQLLNFYNNIRDLDSSEGKIENIGYKFLSGKEKSSSLFDKFFALLKGHIAFLKQLRRDQRNYPRSFVMISYTSMAKMLYYRILSKLFSFKLVISIMEFHPALSRTFREKVRAYLFDYYSFYFADAALPISEYLKRHVEKRFKEIPLLKIPALADFNYFDSKQIVKSRDEKDYFLYCGSIGYREVIDMILKSFLGLHTPGLSLHLVLSGKDREVQQFKKLMTDYPNIHVYTGLDYEDLLRKYANAKALMAPLRNNLQDKARFPQKIPEYLSSGVPVITNRVGELEYYFTDRENIIFADKYSSNSYKAVMQYVIEYPDEAKRIGIEGKNFGRKHFHYENISNSFSNFLNSI